MYIVGQERRLVNPPSQVVAGVRTVTTKMNGRDTLPRCRAHSLFVWTYRKRPGSALIHMALSRPTFPLKSVRYIL